MEELHAIVSGRVQGVMYRDFVKRGARRLGLRGWVRNLPDSTVEVLAQGERGALESLVRRMRRGSLLSRVDGVDIEWRTSSMLHAGFDIVFTDQKGTRGNL